MIIDFCKYDDTKNFIIDAIDINISKFQNLDIGKQCKYTEFYLPVFLTTKDSKITEYGTYSKYVLAVNYICKFLNYHHLCTNLEYPLNKCSKNYSIIADRYIDIFQYVCNTRSMEIDYANNALIERSNRINNGMSFANANYEAFMELRTFKNNEANDKIQKYNELLDLEEELLEIFQTKKKVHKFINALNNSDIFDNFLYDNPQCNFGIHRPYNYAGLKKYLRASKNRNYVIHKRKYPSALKIENNNAELQSSNDRKFAEHKKKFHKALRITNK